MRARAWWIGWLVVSLVGLAGCHRYQVIPDQLKSQVNQEVKFAEIKRNPSRYQGETVVFGGEVLRATRLQDRTRIDVLQLPLSQDLVPGVNRASSEGRFIAFDQKGEILDPAVLQEGTRVTIIGEIQSPISEPLGEADYQYPTLAIRDMTVWDVRVGVSPWPTFGPYWGAYPVGVRPYAFWSGTRVAG